VKTRRKSSSQPALPRARRLAFVIITLLFPAVFFVVLELGLRMLSYGPNLELFTQEEIAGRAIYVKNHEVKGRYFSRFLFNPSTSPDYFEMPKPAGTYRIFCLGGSTTVGYPYWYNGAFSTFLRDRLRLVFPEKHIEVVNVGMTATNSFTVLDMAQDVVHYEPDLLVVYDGHNEFYGALGVGSNESVGTARWLTLLYLKVVHFKTFSLLRDIYQGAAITLRGADAPDQSGTMMEKLASGKYVSYGSTLYSKGLEVFRANLADLHELCATHNVPVLLSSQVSNLRGQPPFVSDDPERVSPDQAAMLSALLAAAKVSMQAGNFREALQHASQALEIDSLHAMAHYLVAQYLDTVGRKEEARQEYIKARNYDRLRFRMSSEFNKVIREATDGQRSFFVDMEVAFARASRDSIIDNSLIVEHLHPNSWGYFLMAKEYARTMRTHELLAKAHEWETHDTLADDLLWIERNLTAIDEVIAKRRTDILTSGWPFTNQTPTVFAIAPNDTLGLIAERVTRAEWNWQQAHEATAEFYLGRRDTASAIKEYQTLVNMIPVSAGTHLKLAQLYLRKKDQASARRNLLQSLEVEKTLLAYRALGDIAMNANDPKSAVEYYEKTFTFTQSPAEQVDNGYLLALALARADNLDHSVNQLLRVLSLKPDYKPAVNLLQEINSYRSRK